MCRDNGDDDESGCRDGKKSGDEQRWGMPLAQRGGRVWDADGV
jgi:hypothetical protein